MNNANSKPSGATQAALHTGDRVGAYTIERMLGSGGMADVYYAVHNALQRPSAIKVLRASLATDDVHLQRFMQEARAAASLVHPNIVQVYDVGQDGEHRYIAQEYIPGSNLRQYLSNPLAANASPATAAPDNVAANPPAPRSPTGQLGAINDRQLSLRETLSIVLQVLAALSKSSASGIVHRDIKPENIMLTEDGEVKVADFGLARSLLSDDPQLTRAGTTLGTPMYMSPEQIQEGQVDVRSDLYSLGVTLYHMLAGRPPFTGETPLALAMQHVQAPVPEIDKFRTGLPDSIKQLVSRLLAKSANERFGSPKEVLEFLRQHREGDLRGDWPEQTMPLPGVAAAGAAQGPMQATLALMSKIREQKMASRRKWGMRVAVAACWIVAFGLGAMLSFSTPFQLFESKAEIYKGIEKRKDVDQQYTWALLNTESSPFSKWQAVGVFFPKEESALNRYYAGLAALQLARAHCGLREYDDARRSLNELIADRAMDDVIKALAHLQMAAIESAAGNDAGRDAAVDRALEIAAGTGINTGDQPRLDANVRLMEQAIQDYWFRNRPASSSLVPPAGLSPDGPPQSTLPRG